MPNRGVARQGEPVGPSHHLPIDAPRHRRLHRLWRGVWNGPSLTTVAKRSIPQEGSVRTLATSEIVKEF